MSIQDPIANLFSSINNAQSRIKENVVVPSSKKKVALVELLKSEGYLGSYEVSEGVKPTLTIKLKYFEGKPVIKQLKRVSKPGLREYLSYKELPSINGVIRATNDPLNIIFSQNLASNTAPAVVRSKKC